MRRILTLMTALVIITVGLAAVELPVIMGAKFAKKHKVKLKHEIHITVPYSNMATVEFPPESGGAFIKVKYVTDKNDFIENLQLTSLKVPMVRLKSRLNVVKKLVEKKILPGLKKNFKDAEIINIQNIEVNKLPTAIIDIKYTNPEIKGVMYARVAGILSPEDREGVLVIGYLNPKYSEVQKDEDLVKQNLGAVSEMIMSIKFEKLKKLKKKKKKKNK